MWESLEGSCGLWTQSSPVLVFQHLSASIYLKLSQHWQFVIIWFTLRFRVGKRSTVEINQRYVGGGRWLPMTEAIGSEPNHLLTWKGDLDSSPNRKSDKWLNFTREPEAPEISKNWTIRSRWLRAGFRSNCVSVPGQLNIRTTDKLVLNLSV